MCAQDEDGVELEESEEDEEEEEIEELMDELLEAGLQFAEDMIDGFKTARKGSIPNNVQWIIFKSFQVHWLYLLCYQQDAEWEKGVETLQ